MADSTLAVTEGSGKLLDTERVTVGGVQVHRQRVEIAGAADGQIAAVFNGAPGTTVEALCVRHAGPVGQDHGVIVTAEVGKVYVENKVRTAITTVPFLQPTTIAAGFNFLAGAALTNVYVMHLTVTADVPVAYAIRDGALAAPVIYYVQLAGGVPFGTPAPPGGYLCKSSVGNGLFFTVNVNCTLYGTIAYIQV